MSVLVCQGCYNKILKTRVASATWVCFLTVLEAESPGSRCQALGSLWGRCPWLTFLLCAHAIASLGTRASGLLSRKDSTRAASEPVLVTSLELTYHFKVGFPRGSDGKESACRAGDPGSTPGWGRSPEKEMATFCSIRELQRSSAGCCPWGHRVRRSWVTL